MAIVFFNKWRQKYTQKAEITEHLYFFKVFNKSICKTLRFQVKAQPQKQVQ